MITATIDTSALQGRLAAISDALVGQGKDASQVLCQEARLLTKTIVNFIPPIRSKWGPAKTSGEMAIRRELSNLFSEAEPKLLDEIGSRFGVKNIQTDITTASGRKQQLNWGTIDPEASRLSQWHKQNRGPRGKIKMMRKGFPNYWNARVVIPAGTKEPYIKEVQQRVGRGKASMAKGAAGLGEKFPSWISRHFGTVSDIAIADISQAQNPTQPSVTFGSRAPGIDRLKSRIQAAVRFREKVLVKRLKLIISGYSADFAKSIRANSRAARTPTEPGETVE